MTADCSRDQEVSLHVIGQQAGLGFAAVAAVGGVCGQTRMASNVMPWEPRISSSSFCGGWNSSSRKLGGAEAVLVGDHDEDEAGIAQAQQRGNAVGFEGEFVEPVDLLVERLGDQRAVAVDEEDFFHGCDRNCRRGFMPR